MIPVRRMNVSAPYRLWFLRRNRGLQALYKLGDPPGFLSALESGAVEGRYGTEPDPTEIERLKSALYSLSDEAAELRELDRRFPLRFLFAGTVFLAAFFFFSYVIRDALPIVDEIVLSLVAAGAFWIWQRRRIKGGEKARRARSESRSLVDRVSFRQSAFISEAELYLESLEDRSARDVLAVLLEGRAPFTHSAEEGESRLLREDVAASIGKKNLQKGRTYLSKLKKKPPEDAHAAAAQLTGLVKDLPLFALHEALGGD